MNNDSNREALLTEYKELRAEIRHYLERREKNINFALTLTTAAVGLVEQLQSPFIFCTSALFIAFLWFDETRRLRAVFRVATYIEVFIETKIPDMGWESIGGRKPIQTNLFGRIVANGIFPIMFVIHTTIVLLLAKWTTSWMVMTLATATLVLYALVVVSFNTARNARKEELNSWEGLKPAD